MPEATLKEKTAKGLFWGGISNFVQQVIGMAFGIAIARILSPDDYGLVAMLAIFTAVANTVMDSGFTTALVNRKTIEHKDYNAVFWFNVFVAFGIYVILFFAAPWIARFYNQPVLVSLSRVLFLTFIISATGVAHNALLLKKIMAKQRGIIDMAAVFGSGVIGLILALNGFAFWGLAIQQLSQVLIIVVLRWRLSPWRPTFEFDWAPLREMFGFSFMMLLTSIISQITHNMLSVILGHNYGKEQTGYYIQGHKWSSLSNTVFSNMLIGVAQPVLLETKSDSTRQKKVFRKMVRFGAFIILPVMFGLAFVGEEFIIISLGKKWLKSLPFLQLFCFSSGVGYINILCLQLLITHERTKEIALYVFLVSTVALSFLLLLHSYGIFFMLFVYIVILFISSLGWIHLAKKCIDITLIDIIKDMVPYLLITFTVLLLAWILTININNVYIRFILKIAIASSLYLTVMRYSNSTIFRESINFLKKRNTHDE